MIKHEMVEEYGVLLHRLVYDLNGEKKEGEWTSYRQPAHLKVGMKNYIYFTDYFAGIVKRGEDLTDKVLEVKVLS